MEFSNLIRSRYSVREYEDLPVQKDQLIKVLDAGRVAPSAVNFQPWHFIAVTKPEQMAKVHEAYPRGWFKKVKNCIVVCGDHNAGWKRQNDGKDHTDIDVAIAVDHMTLQATEIGLGTCWICNFNPKRLTEEFHLPPHLEPIVIISIGHPASKEIPVKKRKSLEEIVSWEEYGK